MDSRMIVPGCPTGPISYYAHDGFHSMFLEPSIVRYLDHIFE